jgi:hypothetical protein
MPPAQTTFTPKAVRFPQHDVDSISYWTQACHWPREYFDESGEMSHLLGRKKSTTSPRRKRRDTGSGAPSSTTPSDQKAREERSAPYKDARYEALLATKGSFMDASDVGIDDGSKALIRVLLEKEQLLPKDSLFRDDLFSSTCRGVRNKNEARVIRDISQLIVPSAEIFATYGANALGYLIESTNEGWDKFHSINKASPTTRLLRGIPTRSIHRDPTSETPAICGRTHRQLLLYGHLLHVLPLLLLRSGVRRTRRGRSPECA